MLRIENDVSDVYSLLRNTSAFIFDLEQTSQINLKSLFLRLHDFLSALIVTFKWIESVLHRGTQCFKGDFIADFPRFHKTVFDQIRRFYTTLKETKSYHILQKWETVIISCNKSNMYGKDYRHLRIPFLSY